MREMWRIVVLTAVALCSGCMEWESGAEEEFLYDGNGLFILSEGNFQYGNASLSYYNPDTQETENEIFRRANGFRLGDVAQSAVMHGGLLWVVVNNSHVIFALDPTTFREVGRITDLTSPRHIHFISDTKAYITQLWDNRIVVVDPSQYEITGYIECPRMERQTGSTEQMVQWGKWLFVNCWAYQNRIFKIDTETDEVVAELEVGIQPSAMVMDAAERLWVLTDGGYENSPYGEEAPSLVAIDAATFSIERRFEMMRGDDVADLAVNAAGDRIYWINDDLWSMSVHDRTLPLRPLVLSRRTRYYALSVAPRSGEIYLSDALDYQQSGVVYRYSAEGELLDEFYVGIIPGSFCWR